MGLQNINNALVSDQVDNSIGSAQAFVDMSQQILLSGVNSPEKLLLFNNLGLSKFESSAHELLKLLVHCYFAISGPTGIPITFSGNDLPVDDIILAVREFVADNPTAGGTLDVSGGTNTIPDPDNVTALTGAGAGWIVTHN